MAGNNVSYADKDESVGFLKVTYIVNKSGVRLTKGFDSEYLARKFVNKLRKSRVCTLVSYPIFH